MKILLDECTPHAVEKGLPTRDIRTVHEMGWAGVKNGELLKRAEAEFDIFITTDKNLRHQQNLTAESWPSSCCRRTRCRLLPPSFRVSACFTSASALPVSGLAKTYRPSPDRQSRSNSARTRGVIVTVRPFLLLVLLT